jgi:hypothetical protein
MKIRKGVLVQSSQCQRLSGFTVPEALIGILLAAIMLLALYGCFASGYSMLTVTREDLRATQILLQRLERVRLCTFDQVKNAAVNPSITTEYFAPDQQGSGSPGVLYTVKYTSAVPTPGSVPEPYRTNMLLVTVGAEWMSGKVKRTRSMQTYVARDGMEGYISDPK